MTAQGGKRTLALGLEADIPHPTHTGHADD